MKTNIGIPKPRVAKTVFLPFIITEEKISVPLVSGMTENEAKAALESAGFKYASAEQDKIPSTYVNLTSEDDIKYMNLLIEHLEDNDDVTEVYHNWENCD